VSDTARDYVLANYPGVEAERIAVIHRGVDTAEYFTGYHPDTAWLENWYRNYPETRGKYVITLPGRLTRGKGVLDFVAVVQGLRQSGIPVHGLLVGDVRADREAGLMNECRRRIAVAGLEKSITLTGYREDLRDILAISGAVVSLARHPEAFGRTVAEALSLGRPVAGYAHGGVGEQLQAMFPAGRAPVGDVDAVCARLADWYDAAPCPAANHRYTLEKMLAATLDLYEEMAGNRRGPAFGSRG
jgi:glycosyltransferase involved in cell wall biosynthesis